MVCFCLSETQILSFHYLKHVLNDYFIGCLTGCEFQQRKTGEKKCLKDGEIVMDGPCKKRRCKISKFNGKTVTELPLLQDIGG